MAAAILSIGTELTRGELVDTNAGWLAERLTELGCTVNELATVDDHAEKVRQTLLRLSDTHDILVVSGGLGPTSDDLTVAALASALGVGLRRHQPTLDSISRRLANLGRTMSEASASQADVPIGAEALPNAVGTAPGIAVELNGCKVFLLPGVPHEMERLFHEQVVPKVAPTIDRRSYQTRLRTFGLPEARLAERLRGIEDSNPGVTLGYRASFPEIEVKIHARAESESKAASLVGEVTLAVREQLQDTIYGEGDDTYPAHVGRGLRSKKLRLALAESCTGGLIGAMLTDVPGSSEFLLLDAVTYANAAKSELLGISPELLRAYGAVSLECAGAMAEGALRLGACDVAISTTGIAGPGGGSEDKPVGTVFLAIAQPGLPTYAVRHQLAGDRARIRRMSAYLGLRLLADLAAGRSFEH